MSVRLSAADQEAGRCEVSGRVLVLAVALLALDAAHADACRLGSPCTKYKRRTIEVDEPVYGYTHSLRGALPAWSVERVGKFLVRGSCKPDTTPFFFNDTATTEK